jgi:hypothetical protein
MRGDQQALQQDLDDLVACTRSIAVHRPTCDADELASVMMLVPYLRLGNIEAAFTAAGGWAYRCQRDAAGPGLCNLLAASITNPGSGASPAGDDDH